MPSDYTLPFAAGLLLVVLGVLLLLGLALRRLGGLLLRRRFQARRRLRSAGLGLMAFGALTDAGSLRVQHATMAHAVTDLVMTAAPRPPADWRSTVTPPAPYLLLAGDVHCHINPPDWSDHVSRHLPETVALARAEGLDFVSLVPHVFTNFFADPAERTKVTSSLADLRARVDARPPDDLILDIGVEYIDPTGHVGMVFGDVSAALASTPLDVAQANPGAFFDTFADQGGILVVNHPLLTPILRGVPLASLDISWQPFTGSPPFRPEIAAVNARAGTFEAANLFVSAFRDRLMLHDAEVSTRAVLRRLDQEILLRKRRLTPVGGTDSHSFHLRPMTFVLANERSHDAIGEAIRAGRTCIGQPAACTFEVGEGAGFSPVGSSLPASERVWVRAQGRSIAVLRNGEQVAAPSSGEAVAVEVAGGSCSVLRAVVDGGYSAPVYVGCPFADR
ncbi:MAG: hypothetical protein U0359_10270 [Byssovorax sp.]